MKREAEEFERALQCTARGERVEGRPAPLVQAAGRVKSLSETVPAPHGLVPGRQRFLAEAARLREARAARRQPTPALRLATAVAMIVLVVGAALGAERAAAASLPGDPLYGARLAAERVRLALTLRPQNRAALLEARAGQRMDEIVSLLEQGRAIDGAVSGRAVEHLQQALAAAAWLEDAAAPPALLRLAEAIRLREQAMRGAAGESPDPAVRALLREMERVREEAHLGQGDPSGLRERLRHGAPPEPTGGPGATPTPEPTETATPPESSPSAKPGWSATPHRTGMPGASPQPSGTPRRTPAMSATPQPTGGPRATHTAQPTGGPRASQTPGPSMTPEPSHGTVTPGAGGTPAEPPGGGGGNKRP
jgi:hypothetical protein